MNILSAVAKVGLYNDSNCCKTRQFKMFVFQLLKNRFIVGSKESIAIDPS